MEIMMRRLLLGLFVAALVGLCAGRGYAQTADEFEGELKAFREKVKTAEDGSVLKTDTASSVDKKTPVVMETPPKEKASAPSGISADKNPLAKAVSPLGPAANLPVGGKPPATSYAMGVRSPEETQAEMEADLANQKKRAEDASFQEALRILMPLSSEQIRTTLESFKKNREAAETPIAMPTPLVHVEDVSLDPSQVPPVIRTASGRVTTLTILDSTGSPWPIQDVSWAGKFTVSPPEEGGHVIRITPDTTHGAGNLSVRLVDLITPVTFTLETGLKEVYYRFDVRIPKRGPLAKAPLIEHGGLKMVAGKDEKLVPVLDGTPPDGSEKLKVKGVDERTNVWRIDGRIYLRTPLTLLSPSWDSSVSSADGMNVYILNDTPVILLSDGGRMVHAQIAADGETP